MSEAYDVAIIGCGPAGLQAGIHAARRKATTIVLGKPEKSALYHAHLENYFGLLGPKEGREVLEIGLEQVKRFGGEHRAEDVLKLEMREKHFLIELESGEIIKSLTLILAMGVSRRKKKIKGEREFLGKGVSYCVDCDGFFFHGLPVAVIGEESAAAHGALTLAKITDPVFLIAKELKISPSLASQLRESRVQVISGYPKEIIGKDEVEGLLLEDGTRLPVKGVFIEEGAKGALQLATTLGVALDPQNMKYIEVDRSQQTNIPGVYAAGDICGPPFQVAKAVGEGCRAGLCAAKEAGKRRREEAL